MDRESCSVTPYYRAMTAHDVPVVHRLECRNHAFPWSEGIFRDCLRHEFPSFVVEIDRQVQAYGVLQIVLDESHLLNICVDKSLQGQGLGRHFLSYLMRYAIACGARMMFLEVRPSNARAIDLYAHVGFHEIGRRHGYYDAHDGREDAIVMARELVLPEID